MCEQKQTPTAQTRGVVEPWSVSVPTSSVPLVTSHLQYRILYELINH